MSLIAFIVILIVLGVLLWAFNQYVTAIDPVVKQIINVVAIVAIVLWVLAVTGIVGDVMSVKVPHV